VAELLLPLDVDAFSAGLGDHRIVTTLCPGGKERMRRLIEMVRSGKLDLLPLLTHRLPTSTKRTPCSANDATG
jgi:threonine dehydrogenase-like Zn-dependent dehydrogenase